MDRNRRMTTLLRCGRGLRPLVVMLAVVLVAGASSALAVPDAGRTAHEPAGPNGCLVPDAGTAPVNPALCGLEPDLLSPPEAAASAEVPGVMPAAASGSAAEGLLDCVLPGDSRCETWVGTHDVTQWDVTIDSAASSSGDRVFVTGHQRTSGHPGNDIITAAFDGETAERLWGARYNGPANRLDMPSKVVVSPDDETVVAIGVRDDNLNMVNGTADFVAVAYDAATGQQRWVGAYDSGAFDFGTDAVFAPDGSTLYMVGITRGLTDWEADFDHLTVAFDADTGETLWATRNGSPIGGYDYGLGIAVSPDGERVATTGWWQVSPSFTYAYGTTLYDTVDDEQAGRVAGEILWTRAWGEGDRAGWGIQFSPDSSVLYVTGTAELTFGTVAYEVATGELLWSDQYSNCSFCMTKSLDLLPNGDPVVTGWGSVSTDNLVMGGASFITLRYNGATGDRRWTTVYKPINVYQFSLMVPVVAVAPDGGRVYLAGRTQYISNRPRNEPTTVALDAQSGEVLWDARYGLPTTPDDSVWALSISAAGGKVFVGASARQQGATTYNNFMVLAYDG